MARFDGGRYQARFDALAAAGADVHGEADLVASLLPRSVLDAGCGTGRVAVELARRGIAVVGVDLDASMIAEAARRGPDLEWVHADLASLRLDRTFDVVLLAGNVPLFCRPSRRAALVAACADHVAAGGAMVAGFGLRSGYTLGAYDAACAAAGLAPGDRWATWDRATWADGGDYAVSVHRRPAAGGMAARAIAVLDVVDAIPAGRVMSYGGIARLLGQGSARQVGQVLARHGDEVPWHRVVMADGSPAPYSAAEQLARLRGEGVPVVAGRVVMARARWDGPGGTSPNR